MQLAGLLDDDLRRGSGGRSLAQKLGQTVAAQQLERSWRKDQILEAYLNPVPFRGEIVGIDALSRTLFGKAPHGLDAREAAVAAALVRAPNAKPALVAQRACERAAGDGAGRQGGLRGARHVRERGAAAHGLRGRARASRRIWRGGRSTAAGAGPRGRAHHACAHRCSASRSTTLQRHLRELRGRNVEDGALVVLDNASGEVLAWVGSSGDLSRAAEVDGVLAQRQPGSTLKPFLYAQAIAERRLTAASLLDDSPAQISTAERPLHPAELRPPVQGPRVGAHRAGGLAQRAGGAHAGDGVARRLRAPAARGRPARCAQNGDYYGYSLALGSAEVSLLALTNAYRTLANGGRFGETRVCLASHASATSRDAPAHRPARRLHRRRHPRRPQRARAHLRPRQRARHALLDAR